MFHDPRSLASGVKRKAKTKYGNGNRALNRKKVFSKEADLRRKATESHDSNKPIEGGR
jgi:hypothetical protein